MAQMKARKLRILFLICFLGLLASGSALAAEFGGGEVYHLEADVVVDDDLYVSGREIFIDGVVNGDLIVAGGYIEINGTVNGDLAAAGGGIVINGEIGDDARVAGAGIDVVGQVTDDLFAAGGGGGRFPFPITFGSRTVNHGIRVADSAAIGGDSSIAGGSGTLNGTIGGNLVSRMGSVNLGARVDGNATLEAGDLTISDTASVGGTLTYSTSEPVGNAEDVATDVVFEEEPAEGESTSFLRQLTSWSVRTLLILIGFVLLGWLLTRYGPGLLTTPADALAAATLETGLYGLVAAVLLIFIPLLSVVLVAFMAVFWGIFPAIVLFLFLFGTLSLIWFLSPLITGLWLGRRVTGPGDASTGMFVPLLVGVLPIVILGRIPILGWLVYLASFVLATGSLIRSRVRAQEGAEVAASTLSAVEPSTE